MTLKLELPKDVEAGLLAQARASGVSLEDYVGQILRERSDATIPGKTRSRIAAQRIRELRKGVTLGGLTVRELIDEGRE